MTTPFLEWSPVKSNLVGITTHDELYKAELFVQQFTSAGAKEVQTYADALKRGFEMVSQKKLLINNIIIDIFRIIKQNDSGFRVTPGTTLKNERTQEIVYEPPQSNDLIQAYMSNLERFINDESISDLDPLVKMAIIHHQFESIHPFSDGNGRTGRIINILYLVQQGLLDLPVLYLSRYVIKNKSKYYELLQKVRDEHAWEEWILFMLKGVEVTAIETINLVEGVKKLMLQFKNDIRDNLPKIYSQDLLINLFRHPYTRIEFVMKELSISRPAASSYLKQLEARELVVKFKLGRENFYLNEKLFVLLMNAFHLYRCRKVSAGIVGAVYRTRWHVFTNEQVQEYDRIPNNLLMEDEVLLLFYWNPGHGRTRI